MYSTHQPCKVARLSPFSKGVLELRDAVHMLARATGQANDALGFKARPARLSDFREQPAVGELQGMGRAFCREVGGGIWARP